jgi:hypothetical protein
MGLFFGAAGGTANRISGRQVLAALAALAPFLLPHAAQADPRDEVVSGMMRCAVITDDRQWLDCYYGAAQPMRARLGLPPAPQAQQRLLQHYYSGAPAAPALAPPVPGRMASRAPAPSGPPPMPPQRGVFSDFFGGSDVVHNGRVSTYKFNPDGSFVVTLTDGQVWAQTGSDSGRHPARWRDSPATMRVTIRQGALRSYNMVLNGNESVQYKVHRLR